MKVRFHPVADAELMEAAQWYEDRSTGNGVRFISAAVDASFDSGKNPLQYPPPPTLRSRRHIRRRLLEGFPYSMIYEVLDTEIRVLALSHARRRPAYWLKRK